MLEETGILLDIQDDGLRRQLNVLISEDSSLSTLADNSLPGRIAVTDNPNYASLEHELVILAGESKRDD
ncbi:MAG: hypothetical protein HRT88_15885, partial [Lentisphaeraceae bacterium]|nr:hypothetical protein [Lentisphaeraceae bacterium]